jgi:uncharacterized membrane protein
MSENELAKSTGMTTHRLESLSDGIFAFAMTLLVLAINLPVAGQVTSVGSYLLGQGQNFWNFALSFLLLSVFWLNHSQQYHHIKKTDVMTLWLNILMLLFVVLIPFSATVINDFPNDLAAEVFFNLNMLVLSSVMTLNWWYSSRKGFIEEAGNKEHLDRVNRKAFYMPAISLLALLLAFIVPGWSSLSYWLIPLVLLTPSAGKK